MDNVFCGLEFNWSAFGEFVRTTANFSTAIVAILALILGKKYFDVGQTNSINVAFFNKKNDAISVVVSNLSELKRLLCKLLDSSTPQIEIENLLKQIANENTDVNTSMKTAQYVEGVLDVRSRYLAWYEKWFVDAEDSGMASNLLDESKRKKTTDQIKSGIESELDAICKDCESLRLKNKPEVAFKFFKKLNW